MSDPITTSLLEITSDGSFAGTLQFDSPGGGALAIRGPSGAINLTLTLPSTTPATGDYLRVNGGGQLYWDAGCSGCGGGGGGITDPGTNGLLVRTDVNTFVTRSIVAGPLSPITVINGDGVAGNIALGLQPGATGGQVLTWDGAKWIAAATTSTGTGLSGGNPNVLTRWLTSSTLQDSALSQDPTGNTVSASGSFVVAGTLKANTFLQFSPFTAPPTGPPGLATIYYQGGVTPLWVASSSAPDAAQWKPINAIMFGSAGGAFGPANRILVGRTGGIVGDGGGVGGGAGFTGPFDGEIYLTPGTAGSAGAGQVMTWNGTAWGPLPLAGLGTGNVSVDVAGGQNGYFPIWNGANLLSRNSGLRQPLSSYVECTTDFIVSNGKIKTNFWLDLAPPPSLIQGDTNTARIAYDSLDQIIVVSIEGQQYKAINAITMAQPGKTPITASIWTLTPPLQSLRSGSDTILRIAPPPVNLTAGQVLTWDGAQWTAQVPGALSGTVTVTPSGNQSYMPVWATTSSLTNTFLHQEGSGDLTLMNSKNLRVGGLVSTGVLFEFAPPSGQTYTPSQLGQARLIYDPTVSPNGQIKLSLNGQPYVPIGGTTGAGISSVAPTTTQRLTKWSVAGNSVTDSMLLESSGGTVLAIGSVSGGTYTVSPFSGPTGGALVDLATNSLAFRNLFVSNTVTGTLQVYPAGSGGAIALTGGFLPTGTGLYDLGGTGAYFRQVCANSFFGGNGLQGQPAITVFDRSVGLYGGTGPGPAFTPFLSVAVQNVQTMFWTNDTTNPCFIRVGGALQQVTPGLADSGGVGSGKRVLLVNN